MTARLLLLACVLALAAGCGQKGPLYLPEDAPEEQSGADTDED